MKQSERNAIGKVQAMELKYQPIMAGDHLAGDQFARSDWQERITQGDSALARLAAAHSAFYQGAKNLRAATETPDPEMTADAHFLRTKKLGDDLLRRAGEQAERAMTFARQEIEAERRALVSDLGLVENHRAAEIRMLVRGLGEQERQKILSDAVAARDAQTIAAITEAPAYLSGVTHEQAKAWRRQYELQHGGRRISRVDTLSKALDVMNKTLTEAIVFQSTLHPQERVADIERKQKVAHEIRKRLETDVSSL